MANPYEEGVNDTGQTDSLNLDFAETEELVNTEQKAKEALAQQQQEEVEAMAQPPDPVSQLTETLQAALPEVDTPPIRGAQQEAEVTPEAATTEDVDQEQQEWEEMKAWSRMPRGPEKEAAQEAWSRKYHGMTYDEYREMRRKRAFIYGGGKGPGEFYAMSGPFGERMRAVGTGLVDTVTDFINLAPGFDLPKATKFEDGLAQGVRNISGLILPMLAIEGAVIKAGTAVHKAGIAPKVIQKLGNNPIFQRFAYKGIGSGTDIGAGVLVDSVVEQNKMDDTLATEWKNNQWVFHQWIPDSWTSDKLSPDQKARANAMEGVRLGFVGGIFQGLTKVIRAGKSVERVSKLTADSGYKQTDLDKLIKDPLDDVKYSDNVVEDQILRNEAKHSRELDKLGKYQEGKPIPKEPTIGVHNLPDKYQEAVRTKDSDGIIGAAVDQARINKSLGTTRGRLGSVITESARQFGLEANSLAKRKLVKDLIKEVKSGGKYSAELASGRKISWKEIDEAGTRLAEILNDPQMPIGDLRKLLQEFKGELNGVKQVDNVGYNAIMKSMKKYMDDFVDLDAQKAKAYLLTSEAGQASDMAEGMRLMDGTSAVTRAQEQILDRLELFAVEKGIAAYEWGARGNALRTWKEASKTGSKEAIKKAKALSSDMDNAIAEIIPNAKNWTQTLRNISRENPEFLKPLMLAYEFSNGDINSMHKLNKYVENSLGVFSKAFVDGNPQIPSIINRAWWSTLYNSALSAVATPTKALMGNFGGLIAQPTNALYGALREGDLQMLRRGAHQYFGLADTFQVGWKHMSEVYGKASRDPNSISYVIRDDLVLKEAEGLEVIQSWAKAAEKEGEYGASALLTIYEEQQALANHPWLRFGANSMTALDGFARATQKLAQDKGDMFDLLMKKYPDGNWTQKEFQEGWKELYKKNWDENGMISDEAVDFATREIALNLDSPLVKGIDTIIRHIPIMRSVLMFPKTSMNILEIFGKYSQASRFHAGHKFAGDYGKFLGPGGKKGVKDFSLEEIRELLSSRGISMDGDYISKFKAVRNEIRGRVATGTGAVTAAWLMATQDRIRGNGHWDKNVQRTRRETGWKPKTYQGLDGNWHSYEWMGPIGDWLALTTDMIDNFDSVSTTTFEEFGKKLSFILGASLTNRSVLSNLEPLGDIFAGNPAAGARWASNFTNLMLPLSGQRNELGRVMSPMLREVDQDYLELIRNRNTWTDAFDPEGALPPKYDWVTGKIAGIDGGFFTRARNAYTPFKVFPDQSPEQQFLLEIEYDNRPHFNKSTDGIALSSTERSELYSLVGKQGVFRKYLKRIMVDAGRLEVTIDGKTIKGYVNILRHIRSSGRGQEFLKEEKFANIHHRVDLAINRARRIAEASLSNIDEIRRKAAESRLKDARAAKGDIDSLLELNQPTRQ